MLFYLQIMVCRADEKTQICVVEFNMPYEVNHKPCTSDKFSLYVSTRAKDLFNYIEEHYHMPPDSFKLILCTSSCKMVNFLIHNNLCIQCVNICNINIMFNLMFNIRFIWLM